MTVLEKSRSFIWVEHNLVIFKTYVRALNLAIQDLLSKRDKLVLKFPYNVTNMDKEKLKELVECPICFEVKRNGVIYQCVNGHIICSRCFGKLSAKNCPSGKCQYSDPPSRGLILEKLIADSDLEFDCWFKINGCGFVGSHSTLNLHESSCSFKSYICFKNSSCKMTVLMQDMLQVTVLYFL